VHHIAKNDGNLFEPNGSVPLFAFKRREKVSGCIIGTPVVIRYLMGCEIKTTDFAVDLISTFYYFDFLLRGFFEDFFFDTFSRCSDKAFRIAG
jgi:hypothetical protein